MKSEVLYEHILPKYLFLFEVFFRIQYDPHYQILFVTSWR